MTNFAADHTFNRTEAREFCEKIYHHLDDNSRTLLSMVYADNLSYREIAQVLGISEVAVCHRHKALVDNLRWIRLGRRWAA